MAEEAIEAAEIGIIVVVSRDSPEPLQAASPISLKTKVRVRVRVSLGDPDTPQTHQKPVAAVITDTEPTLGSVLLPSPVLGSTRSQLGHEGQTSLDK